MDKNKRPVAKGCAIFAAVVIGIPLLAASVVSVKTWVPLQRANDSLAELDRILGEDAVYVPSPSGAVSADRLEVFLALRGELADICGDSGTVQRGFESVAALESSEDPDLKEVGDVAADLGGTALEITPYLARFFEARNNALLAASMGLQEYSYIYAVAYRERLLSAEIRNEVFSDGNALSHETAVMLRKCLNRQRQKPAPSGQGQLFQAALATEAQRMADDPLRLIWQDALPVEILASIAPFRDRLDLAFCGATAGLEMEQGSRRAIRVALE